MKGRIFAALLLALVGCSEDTSGPSIPGPDAGGGETTKPAGACTIPDRGTGGTYVENGWYFCPADPASAMPKPEIQHCESGALVASAPCTCKVQVTTKPIAANCASGFGAMGRFNGDVYCSYAGLNCSHCVAGGDCK